jgi:hypothetical protein
MRRIIMLHLSSASAAGRMFRKMSGVGIGCAPAVEARGRLPVRIRLFRQSGKRKCFNDWPMTFNVTISALFSEIWDHNSSIGGITRYE